MMLGIAARSSMATPMGVFRKFGAISVIKTAMPIETGIAINKERKVVRIVHKYLSERQRTP